MLKLSPLGDLIDIKEQIDLDREIDRATLRQRDREIGLMDDGKSNIAKSKLAHLRRWISEIRPDSEITSKGHKVDKSMRSIIVLCWLVGGISGYLLASSVLAYDGSQPVNLLIALLVLIGVQSLALILLCILLLFNQTKILEALSILNPANLIMQLISRIQPSWREAIEKYFSRFKSPGEFGLLPQMTTYLAQHFAIALNIGILASLFYLVTISDLAFGWNTTLNIQNETVSQFLQGIATPWQTLLPAAVPDDTLVESSRFYRLQSKLHSDGWEARELGTWWLFLAMCIVVYGFLPRLIALVIAGIHYDKCVAQATLSLNGSSQVLARMSDPLVSADAPSPEVSIPVSITRPGLPGRQAARKIECVLIEWSECEIEDKKLSKVGIVSHSRLKAGGRRSISEDKATIKASSQVNTEGIAISIKAWEPPLLDFIDFISLLRKSVSTSLPIIVLLKALPNETVSATQIETWETALGTVSDSALYLESL